MNLKSVLFLSLLTFFSINSFSLVVDHPSAPYRKKFTKNVWSTIELNGEKNEVLFKPYNEFQAGWDSSERKHTKEAYENQKDAIKFNLWSIIRYKVIMGELTAYSPFDPNWVDTKDHGFLMYPITSKKYGSNGTFFTDKDFRHFIKEGFLGKTDYTSPLIPVKSVIYPSNDSINENGDVVYYPRDFTWYKDQDIVQYKIREHWIMTEDGSVIDKEILAIAPQIKRKNMDGNVIGIQELFWIDYSKLEKILKKFYIYSDDEQENKIFSYRKFFRKRKFEYEKIKQDSVYVKPVK